MKLLELWKFGKLACCSSSCSSAWPFIDALEDVFADVQDL
eukprot:CAMPEP_0206476014 /NCGR_PEP_ID=MMETSP0324_2-20121206/34447_1 /ASSEMBLY_ACC=CAM_ASM_000836 /TAXON_ID=2866 /ORGANISM="Crypthecodinium cohnii, Strain Seligo" /LENGTH=39 /DNA_ID= /DNA_START= /DNA_END= /DNA_ORIENTATION=